MKLLAIFLSVLISSLILGPSVFAASSARKGDRVVYRKHTVIDLSGAVIEGELVRPEGSYIVNRKLSRFSNLIQDRQNFLPELLVSADDL